MPETPMKKQALLIGIDEYQILPGLKYARQDAEAVADALKQNYSFSENEVMLLTDSRPGLFKPTNRYIIQDHLEKLANQELDLFIFGFWGHCLFRNGKRYLCPLDVMTARAERQGLPFDELQELLANIHAKNTCLILDCCQTIHDRGEAETLTASDKASMENAARDIVLRRKTHIPNFQSNVAILNSCKEGQNAYEWDARQHGLFTAHLLDAMNKRCTSVLQIASYISSNIEKTALELGKDQTPFYKLEGDIVLPVITSTIPLSPEFVLPERSKDAVIQQPVIEDINVTVTPAQIEQSQPIQYKKIQLPPIPDELARIQAENKGREQTIAQLKDFTHESLSQANAAVAQAQAQFNAWDKRKERLWKDLPKEIRQSLKETISGNLQCTEADIKVSTENMSNQEYLDLLEQFQCGKKHEQARLELERVQKQRLEKCNDVIKELQQKIESENAKVEEIKTKFMDEVLLSILAVLPRYENHNAAFPDDKILEPLRLLDKYELGWRAPAAISRARVLWNEHHSGVLKTLPIIHVILKQHKSNTGKLPPTSRSSFEWDGTKIKKFIGKETEVVIPEGTTEIGAFAFDGCSSLTTVVIPEGVTYIGECAFSGCSFLKSVVIPEGVTVIGGEVFGRAFSDCSSLTSVVIPKGVTEIEWYAFSGCSSLTSVVIPEGVTYIGESAFEGCSSLTSVAIPKGVTEIGEYAFNGCNSLTSVEIPESVKEIGISAFSGCSSLTSVVIPEGVTKIGAFAFDGCSSLTSVVIPEGVTEIGTWAFYGCNSLTSVVIPEGVTVIGDSTFSGCSSLTSVVIPEGVKEIGDRAFSGCSSLTSVVIPEGVTEIGNSTFSGCSSLTSVVIHGSITEIGNGSFNSCRNLSSLIIHKGVRKIGYCAFECCSSLISVVIPEGVTEIGDSAFYGCSSLTSVAIPDGITKIGSLAFSGCSSLTSVVIPEGVTVIGECAFYNCNSLTSVVIPRSVRVIGKKAFYGCPVLWFSRAWCQKFWEWFKFWEW